MKMLDSSLEQLLTSLKGEDIVYIPNRGNAGDSFIAHATYQVLERIGLRYETGNQYGVFPGRTVIFAGGGNLVAPYHNGLTFLKSNLGLWKKLIILPHTIRAYEGVLSQLESNAFVFCREQASYDFVKKHAKSANTFIADDMAFACDFAITTRQMKDRRLVDLFNRVLLVRNAKRLARSAHHRLRTAHAPNVLDAFRTDLEKTTLELPKGNFDVSQGFSADDPLQLSSLHATYWMMSFIGSFDIVRTNRLHVGIMAAMLGRELHLYDNSYGKVRDIYEYSLRERFPNVIWKGSATPAEGSILRRA